MADKLTKPEAARRTFKLFGNGAKGRGKRRADRPQVFRPAVELLEDRLAPAIVTSNGDIQMIAPPSNPQSGPPLIDITRLSLSGGFLFTNQVTGTAFATGSLVRTIGAVSVGSAIDGTNTSVTLPDGSSLAILFAIEGTIVASNGGVVTARFDAGRLFLVSQSTGNGSVFNVHNPATWNFDNVFAEYALLPQQDVIDGSTLGIPAEDAFAGSGAGSISFPAAQTNVSAINSSAPQQQQGIFLFDENSTAAQNAGTGFVNPGLGSFTGDNWLRNIDTAAGTEIDPGTLTGVVNQTALSTVTSTLTAADLAAMNTIALRSGFTASVAGGLFATTGTGTQSDYTPTGLGAGTGDFEANNTGDAYIGYENAPTPAIQIVKLTNGTNNDNAPVAGTPDGPLVQAGSTVTWTYDVTANGSQEPIANVAVTDSVAGVNPQPVLSGGFNVGDTNQNGLLDPGETWVFTASGTAILGQYSNVGTVTGTSTVTSTPVTANNPDHYFGVDAFISITPLTPANEVTHNGINHAETFTITVTALPGTAQLNSADVAFSTPTISYPLGAPDLAAPTTATFVSRTGNVATYTVTINSNKAGTFEVKASDTVTFTSSMSPNSPFQLTRTTGDGFSDANGSDSPDAVKNYVNALIRITPLTATNLVNAPHTFTITVTAFPAGTGTPTFGTPSVSVSPAPNLRNGPVTPLSGPTNNGNGTWTETWTYTINSNKGGTFTAQASDTVTMGGVTVTRTTGDRFTTGDGSDGPNAVKTYVTAGPAVATSLSGCVFLDVNNNGVHDATDIPIASVGVTLFKLVGTTWVPVARTFTNAAGDYSFTNLSPGVYRIADDFLPQFLQGKDVLGTVNGRRNGVVVGDTFSNIVLNAGDVGIDFCFAKLPTKAMFFGRR